MSPIQQMFLGVGAVATKTYVDDIFSTFLYEGTGSAQSMNNGIDLSGEGGMTWIKQRTGQFTNGHFLFDTERGAGKYIKSDSNATEQTSNLTLSAFNTNGFSVGSSSTVNLDYSSYQGTYASWTLRKASGFFDVVTYSGNSTNRTIAHSLGSVPGFIIVKCLTETYEWHCYHRDVGNNKILELNNTSAASTSGFWNNTDPTATHFSVGTNAGVNGNGQSYVAYVFAGGESTAATARSVDFDGSGDYLSLADSDDFDMGTGDFTVECWINLEDLSSNRNIWTLSGYDTGGELFINSNGLIGYYVGNQFIIQTSTGFIKAKQWYHLAVTRASGTARMFINGTEIGSASQSGAFPTSGTSKCYIGAEFNGAGTTTGTVMKGEISNFRVIKGTAVYTSSFRPPTEPLTNITNTKLLCCNNSSTTGSTVTPGTITANGNPTASTDSPFDDPAGFVFGDAGESVIKCGSYVGSGSAGLEVNVGFEPQWIMFKNASASYNWYVLDVMRGIVSNGDEAILSANTNSAEFDSSYIDVTPTGFKVQTSHALGNGSGNTYIYMCLRRSDGYVGKPPELGTGVFAIDQGNSSATQMFTSGFPVDFATEKFYTTGSYNWGAASRLTAKNYLYTNTTAAEAAYSSFTFDQMDGWGANSGWDSTAISYMWKRHAGFDVVCYSGNGVSGRQMPHSMGVAPEMMWVKRRNSNDDWITWHKGLNGGTNPEDYYQKLNNGDFLPTDDDGAWNDTAPTSTHFTLGNNNTVNSGGTTEYIAMLFASVKGISALGYYSGNNSGQTITIPDGGFQPRFIIIKSLSYGSWYVFDTVRGWTQALTLVPYLRLDLNSAQSNNVNDQPQDVGYPTSTGFYLTGASGNEYVETNKTGKTYIWYAHA